MSSNIKGAASLYSAFGKIGPVMAGEYERLVIKKQKTIAKDTILFILFIPYLYIYFAKHLRKK
jgi:hypothetical protein